jgi:hypothetical protein
MALMLRWWASQSREASAGSHRQVAVLAHPGADGEECGGGDLGQLQAAELDLLQESGSQIGWHQIAHLGDHRPGGDQRTQCQREEPGAAFMVGFAAIRSQALGFTPLQGTRPDRLLMQQQDQLKELQLEQLRQEIQNGLTSGEPMAWNPEAIKAEGRALLQALAPSNQDLG